MLLQQYEQMRVRRGCGVLTSTCVCAPPMEAAPWTVREVIYLEGSVSINTNDSVITLTGDGF